MIISNADQRILDREEELEERTWLENQERLKREHELVVLDKQYDYELKRLQASKKLDNKLKKVVIHCITILRLFKRKVPKTFTDFIS